MARSTSAGYVTAGFQLRDIVCIRALLITDAQKKPQ
jgi:hypothetical protein